MTAKTNDHIACNKGDDAVSREVCIEAIRLLQDFAKGRDS